jgi:hypothetical protein
MIARHRTPLKALQSRGTRSGEGEKANLCRSYPELSGQVLSSLALAVRRSCPARLQATHAKVSISKSLETGSG